MKLLKKKETNKEESKLKVVFTDDYVAGITIKINDTIYVGTRTKWKSNIK